LAVAVELKFGADGVVLLPELRQIADPERSGSAGVPRV
jgi:hypothetical protein